MCYAPIKIRNNSLTYRAGIDKMYFTVPCGKCRECQQRKRDDWFIRLYYEWLNYKDDGQVIFITMTYNDWSKPFVSLADTELQVLDEYCADMYRMSISPVDGKHLTKQVHTIDYYEKTFELPFPISHYDFIDEFGECIDRFDKEHVSSFIKSFRQYLHIHKLLTYDEQSIKPVKYFCAFEYGGSYHRQHYHFLLYLPKKFDVNEVKEICEHCWSDRVPSRSYPDFIKDYISNLKERQKKDKTFDISKVDVVLSTPDTNWKDWHIYFDSVSKRMCVFHLKGFCMYSKDNPPVILGGSGLEYVVKYLYKADDFLKEDRFKKLRTWLQFFPPTSTCEDRNKKLSSALQHMREIFPTYMNSQKFGDSLFQELNSKSVDDLVSYLNNPKPINMTESAKFYAVPQYVINRLLYNGVDVPLSDNTTRMLTDTGYKCVCKMFDTKLYSLAKSYAEQVNVALPFVSRSEKLSYFAKTGKHLDIVVRYVQNFKALAHYSLVWQNVSPKIPDSTMQLWSDAMFFQKSRELYFQQKSPSFEFNKGLKGFDFVAMQYASRNSVNYYKAFEHYDEVLDALSYIRQCVGVRDARHEFDDENKVSKYRELQKKFKYDS